MSSTSAPNFIVTGIKDRIKEARENAKLTQASVAKFLEISRTAITQWEAGLTFPSYDKLIEMAKLMHVRPEWLAFNVSNPVEYRVPDDVVKVPVVRFGDNPDARETVQTHYLSNTFVADSLRVPADTNLFVYEIETEAFMPRFAPGDQIIVDATGTRVTGDAIFLIWNGMAAQVVSITANPAKPGTVRVSMTEKGFSEEGRHYDVEASKLNVLGRVRGRISRAL